MTINLNHAYCSCGPVVTVAVVDNAQDCCKSKFLNCLQKKREWETLASIFQICVMKVLLATMHAVLWNSCTDTWEINFKNLITKG